MERPARRLGKGADASHLSQLLDSIIKEHGGKNPALDRDLEMLRKELDASVRRGRASDLASTALKIAAWVKFIYDFIEPD